ncbi:RimK family alpha-L-glutamate ligase [Micromonospora sp. NPDC051300]|uniref:RimK family alpha-L-glutamate ligase n=1 Tax=Micromonospora sp. NPDC051300 TaxID=3364286 RepID=UPI00379255FD
MNAPTVALLASTIRVEEKQIMAALSRRDLAYTRVDPRRLRFNTDGPGPPYSFALNREISQTRAEYAAEALEACGVVGVNSAAAVGTCGDKWRTSLALRARGLPTPRTALALTPQAALDALDELGYPAVIKPLVGSWGRLVGRLTCRDAAETVLEHVAALPSPRSHVVYLQEQITTVRRDLRVIVVGDQAVGVTWRRAEGWRANVATGANSVRCLLTAPISELAVAATEAVGAEIAGVDLLEDRAGDLYVLEVNHRVEFAGFQAAHGDRVDVAERIADYLGRRAGA